jgi:hypothetical protein
MVDGTGVRKRELPTSAPAGATGSRNPLDRAAKEVLDGALVLGMERGLRVTMDRLDELVASLP